MAFYDLDKTERQKLTDQMNEIILSEIRSGKQKHIISYFSDEDTYIRKTGYLAIGKIVKDHPELKEKVIQLLLDLIASGNEKIRQTVVNAAGEIGKTDFPVVATFMETGLVDEHHSVRNAVIGSIKKMGEKNPVPVLQFSKRFLHHPDKEIRREICHGIELRGRTHPQEILPMLQELQFDKTARVRNTLVHVIGQIAYKKGCLETVIAHIKKWENRELVLEAIDEIIDVHERYKNFSVKTQQEAIDYIAKNFK